MFSLYALMLVASLSGMFTLPVSTRLPAVVVLSFDGFKPEYITEQNMPNLYMLRQNAAGPKSVRSVFPTNAFVTHFSLSTGVYPDVHGVYANKFFNENCEIESNTREQFQSNKDVTPIWIENQRTGDGRDSGLMMWPGSEYEYNGTIPTYIEKYNPEIPWNKRAKKIVDWMTNTDQKANLVMAYFENYQCYDKNDKTQELNAHIKKVDDIIQKIHSELNENIKNDLHFIIMSGHGTKEISGENVMVIENYVKTAGVKFIVSGAIVFIKTFTPKMLYNLRNELDNNEDSGIKYVFYEQNELNNKWQISKISGFEKVIVLAAVPGYTFYEKDEYIQKKGTLDTQNFFVEESGYDVDEESMNCVFMGLGPKFKKNFLLETYLDLIDVYPLLKTLLGLKNNKGQNFYLNENVKELLEPDEL